MSKSIDCCSNAELRGEIIDVEWFEHTFLWPEKDAFATHRWKSQIDHVVIEVDNFEMGTLTFKQLTAFQRRLGLRNFENHWIVVHVFKNENELHYTLVFDH